MPAAPLPPDDDARVAALLATGLMERLDDPQLHRIVELAKRQLRADNAYVTFLDATTQWLAARSGGDEDRTPRSESFCGYTILQDDLLLVPDASEDDRFRDHPAVQGTGEIRMYAGAPLRTLGGYPIGSLCVVSSTPRTFSKHEKELLASLGEIAEGILQTYEATAAAGARDFGDRLAQLFRHADEAVQAGDTFATQAHATLRAIAELLRAERLLVVEASVAVEGMGRLATVHPDEEHVIPPNEPDPRTVLLRWQPTFEGNERSVSASTIEAWARTARLVSRSDGLTDADASLWTLVGDGCASVAVAPCVVGEVRFLVVAGFRRDRLSPEMLTLLGRVGEGLAQLRMLEIAKWRETSLQRDLAFSEERYRMFTERAPVTLFEADLHGDWRYVNARWTELTGLTPQESLGRGWANALHPDDRARVFADWFTRFPDERMFTADYRVRNAAGEPRWLAVQVVPVNDADGRRRGYLGTCVDVTARKNLERELAKERDFLNHIFATSVSAILLCDHGGRIVFANRAAERVLGLSFMAMSGRRFDDERWDLRRTDGQPLSPDESPFHRVRRELKPVQDMRISLLDANGKRRLLSVNGAPMGLEGDVRNRFIFSVSDITDAEEAHARLRRTRALLEESSRAAQIGTWEVDLRTNEHFWSAKTLELHELDRVPSVEEGIQYYEEGPSRDALREAFHALVHHHQPYDLELTVRTAKGRRRWVRVVGLPIVENGVSVYAHGLFQDITEQREAQTALRDEVESSQALLRNIVDGLVILRSDGQIDGISPSAERLFARERDELAGRQFTEFVIPRREPAEPPASDAGLLDTLRHASVVRPDGETRFVEVSTWTFPRGGHRFMACLLRDVTDTERLDRMKREFVSTVSHELRTPLTSISGALDLLARGGIEGIPNQALRMIDVAHKNSERLRALINDLLDAEKLAAGKLAVHRSAQSLRTLVEASIDANRPYGDRRNVTLRVDDMVDATVHVDPDRFHQILANLLSNAVKFSAEGSDVIVRTTADDAQVHLQVIDFGEGIPLDFQPFVFQMFSQADGSDARSRGGTGLGLAITRQLVERMDGTIAFESVPGHGTTFTVSFPRAHDTNEPA